MEFQKITKRFESNGIKLMMTVSTLTQAISNVGNISRGEKKRKKKDLKVKIFILLQLET